MSLICDSFSMYVQFNLYKCVHFCFCDSRTFQFECLHEQTCMLTGQHQCASRLPVCASMPLMVCLCVCFNMNAAVCDISAWATCSWSTVASERSGSAPNPVELTPVSLSARLLNCPVPRWLAASSTDNPQTMSNTDSSTALLWDIGGRHRPRKTETQRGAQKMLHITWKHKNQETS